MKRIIFSLIMAVAMTVPAAAQISSCQANGQCCITGQCSVNENTGDEIDAQCRREILKWIEDYKNHYRERDINAIGKIFREDAFALTDPSNVVVRYRSLTKDSFIRNLKLLFSQNDVEVDLQLSDISITQCLQDGKERIYGVTFHQKLQLRVGERHYTDSNWLFVIFDFRHSGMPEILTCIPQDDREVMEKGIYTLDDFNIPQ